MILVNGFYQSQELSAVEQKYYTAARHFLRDNGLGKFAVYLQNAIMVQPAGLNISYERFLFVLRLASADYTQILFHPTTFKNDN